MILTTSARRRVRKIHALSETYNSSARRPHLKKLLELMAEHVREIAVLSRKKDPHAIVETGDLLVLCLEMILEGGRSPDEVVDECFGRYEKKLNTLLRERKYGESARRRKAVS